MSEQYVLAIDQGTTSTRAIVFDAEGQIRSVGQREHQQMFPRAGWVEHDPVEIWDNTRQVIGLALGKANATGPDLAAIGITNQRETTVVWDRATGEPVHHAIVWQDTRTQALVDEIAVGPHADVIGEATLALRFGLTSADLASTLHPYLTWAEGVKLAAQAFTQDVTRLSCCA